MSENRWQTTMTVATLLTASWGVEAMAQTADSVAASSADSSPVGLSEVVVTARQIKETERNVPESMTVLGSALIDAAGVTSVQDVAALTPNFVFDPQPTPGSYNFSVRGISQAQGGEAPVAFVVDGVEVPDPLFINESLLDIDQIQVLRGPQGSLYGRNALAGAIIINTRQPNDQFAGTARAGAGNGGERYGNLTVSGPLVEAVLFGSAAVSVDHLGGLQDNIFEHVKADSHDIKTYLGRLVFKPVQALTVSARVNLMTRSGAANTFEMVTAQQFQDYGRSFLAEDPQPIGQYHLLDSSVKVDYDFGFATLTSITGYNAGRTRLSGDADFTPVHFLLQNVERDVFARTEELRLTANEASKVQWVVGGFFQSRDTLNALIIPFDNGFGQPNGSFAIQSHDNGTSRAWAGFGQATTEVLPKTDLTLGLRYDRDARTSVDADFPGSAAAKTFSATQPKVSLEYHWTPDIQTYVTAAEGFRSGGFNAYFSVLAPTRDYAAQVDKDYEIGLKASLLEHRLSLDVDAYHTNVSNFQLYFIETNPPSQNITSIDRVHVDGAEAQVTAQVARGLQVSLGGGLAYTRIKSFALEPTAVGNVAPLAPEYSGQLSVSYLRPITDHYSVAVFTNLTRRGPVYWDSANTLSTKARDILASRISLKLDERYSVTLWGKNLLNQQYPEGAAVDAFGPGLSGRYLSQARTYGLELEARF